MRDELWYQIPQFLGSNKGTKTLYLCLRDGDPVVSETFAEDTVLSISTNFSLDLVQFWIDTFIDMTYADR